MKDKPDPRHRLPKRRLTETRRIETPEVITSVGLFCRAVSLL
ncbi:hypothetical protein Z945_3781 [Sulfitobacter noctilucae]|nr:hypothetical protein [Sulfitobacter noctilucae]KIN69889.1 hypothetical protein Z945_3781 [Sulfitobacter noctilucae]